MIAHMLKQNIQEADVSSISHFTVHIKKSANSPVDHGSGATKSPKKFPALVIHVVIVLLLKYHIVHDHTSSYDLPHCLLAPSPSMAPNNSPTRLVHTKCPLHIIPSSFLLFNKPTFFLFFRIADCLHKCGPTKIYNRLNNTLFHGGGHRYHS
jgi:hypothetical protein